MVYDIFVSYVVEDSLPVPGSLIDRIKWALVSSESHPADAGFLDALGRRLKAAFFLNVNLLRERDGEINKKDAEVIGDPDIPVSKPETGETPPTGKQKRKPIFRKKSVAKSKERLG